MEYANDLHPEKEESKANTTRSENDPGDDLDLESAIGDAFKQFAMLNEAQEPVYEGSTEQSDDVDLERAVGNVFDSFQEFELNQFPQNGDKPQIEMDFPEGREDSGQDRKEGSSSEVLDINEALNPSEVLNMNEALNLEVLTLDDNLHEASEIEDATDLEAAIGDAFKSLTEPEKEAQEEQNLEDAIGEVFENLTNTETKEPEKKPELSSDEILRQAISESLNSIYVSKEEGPPKDPGLNIAGIVQDVVGRMNTEEPSQRRQSMINELADNISSKVKDRKDLPLLDDNVLAHFHTVANKEESLDDAIKTAVASAVNSASQKENELDLEKLHMNEILQNAFNMAMLNPQELITSLDIEEESRAREQSNALSTAAAIAALSVKDALNRKEPEVKEKPEKPLSIAETLALHRASMAGSAKRDYSTIQTLEDSMNPEAPSVQMNPQLSNILSSLSHHIQSGTQSQNLMLVIRQMTNALMLNKTSISVTKRVLDIVQGFKKLSAEEKMCIGDLKEARTFLHFAVEDSQRAQTLLTSIIGFIRPQEKADPKTKEEFSPLANPEQVKELFDCAHSAISNYSNTRFRLALAGVKRDVDSSEYKERVRIENRERKKKWREENAERNKDNDLRARVLRRAAYMFGEENSEEKTLWMEDEFSKRREKRFARQQKEEISDHDISTEGKHKPSLQNSKLSAIIGNYLHLVGESGSEIAPEATLAATSAVIAVALHRFTSEFGVKDTKSIQSTMSLAVNSILDSSIRTGDYIKLPFLKADTEKRKDTYMDLSKSEPLQDQKRTLAGMLDVLAKRKKVENKSVPLPLKVEPRNAPPASWNASSGLKMPHYRKPTGEVQPSEVNEPSLSKAVLSPFISNKVGKDTAAVGPGGLRKPGSFQRPAYARPSKNSGGFLALYSTSFKQK